MVLSGEWRLAVKGPRSIVRICEWGATVSIVCAQSGLLNPLISAEELLTAIQRLIFFFLASSI
jgi:hypothetical protein